MILNNTDTHNLLYARSSDDGSSGLSPGTIIGIVAGLAGFALLLFICKFVLFKNTKSDGSSTWHHSQVHTTHIAAPVTHSVAHHCAAPPPAYTSC
ncbi:hypothetical protein GY45DRAFT_1315916 [Cubamyces sp. BRFM 1775]|nr:hypothetical protein GY45DRAFT_1315916 [Cubamyces sp. BRFM 1775]